jgi:hypothetical protein
MATEDLTTYTEVDPATYISKTTTRVDWTNLPRNVDAYLYKDKGDAHFSGDFEHLLTTLYDAGQQYSAVGCWCLANILDDACAVAAADGLFLQLSGRSTYFQLELYEYLDGVAYSDISSQLAFDTPYYVKIKRDENVGDHGTLYAYIYSDAERTELVDTLTLTLHEKQDFRYIYAATSYNSNNPGYIQTGYCENLDLQEAPPTGFPHSTALIIG